MNHQPKRGKNSMKRTSRRTSSTAGDKVPVARRSPPTTAVPSPKIDRQAIAMRLSERQQVLEKTRVTLKEEFVGIDESVDAIIEAISPWFLFPEAQERPLVVNLWGMTGVGKSAVIERLVELLSFDDRSKHFILSEHSTGRYWRFEEDFMQRDENEPFVLILDEFQHARTLTDTGGEIKSSEHPAWIWQFIDSGTLANVGSWVSGVDDVAQGIFQLQGLLEQGVEVEDGRATQRGDLVIQEFSLKGDNRKKPRFVPDDLRKTLFRYTWKHLDRGLRQELDRTLDSLSGPETIRFMTDLLIKMTHPPEKTFRRLLVFVLGNLDEAFRMADEIKPDIDAEVFYQETRHIGLPEIKAALQRRFRSEQIARLGNIHIIYPGIRKTSFERFIERQLEQITEEKRAELGIELTFDPTVNRLLYQEGVCPTQGFRPLISSIQQILISSLSAFFADPRLWHLAIERLSILVEDGHLRGEGISAGGEVYRRLLPVPTPLSDRRREPDAETIAITAVHEAGHAVAGILLRKHVPVSVCSTAAEAGVGGRTVFSPGERRSFRGELSAQVAESLAGFVAEKMVFGSDSVSSGARSDIRAATAVATDSVKELGFGTNPIRYASNMDERGDICHDPAVENEVKTVIAAGLELAEQALRAEWVLVLQIADRLTRTRKLGRAEIIALCREFARTDLTAILDKPDGTITGFRSKLDRHLEQAHRLQPSRESGQPVRPLPGGAEGAVLHSTRVNPTQEGGHCPVFPRAATRDAVS